MAMRACRNLLSRDRWRGMRNAVSRRHKQRKSLRDHQQQRQRACGNGAVSDEFDVMGHVEV